jgi:hypothetical protein
MGDYVNFTFEDGTSVLIEAFPAPARVAAGSGSGADLPPGANPPAPVSRGSEILEKTGEALSEALRPLIPVLQSVHDTVSKAAVKPEEITVECGLKLSSELHLMIVGANGEASFTVSAKWVLH